MIRRRAAARDDTATGSSPVANALPWVLSTLGLSGIVYVVGYIVETSYRDFLGLAPSNPPTLVYVGAAGEFIVAIWRSAVSAMMESPVRISAVLWGLRSVSLGLSFFFVVLGVVAIGAALHTSGWGGRGWLRGVYRQVNRIVIRSATSLWRIGCAALCVLSAYGMYANDWPVVPIERILAQPATLDRLFETPAAVSVEASKAIWRDIVCSRLTTTEAQKRGCSCRPEEHQARLRNSFLWNVLGSGMLTLMAGVLFRMAGNGGVIQASAINRSISVAMVMFVVLHLLTLPYVYARVLRSTVASEVIVDRRPGGLVVGDLSTNANGIVVKDADGWTWEIRKEHVRAVRKRNLGGVWSGEVEWDAGDTYDEVHGYLLGATEKTITLYGKATTGIGVIWEIPRERILVMKTELTQAAQNAASDVLAVHISYSYRAKDQE